MQLSQPKERRAKLLESNLIYVSMFGDCSIEYQGRVIDCSTIRSKKVWALLHFLIFNRNREISREELIELVYSPDDSSNPQNALKTLVHRCRSVLAPLAYADTKLMILQQDRAYKWNAALPLSLDAERFDELYERCRSLDFKSGEAFELCREALSLYRGDFLPKDDSAWVSALRERYRSRYLELVRFAISELSAREEYDELVLVCRNALSLFRYDEYLYCSLMTALVKQGKTQIAMSVYERTTKLFFTELGITPSDELQTIYRQIIRSTQNVELDINVIKNKLKENIENSGAFFCEYEFFKDIYHIASLIRMRTGITVQLCLFSVVSSSGLPLPTKQLNSTMERLKTTISSNLRRGDIFARYSVSQFIILLPLATLENAIVIAERILASFYHRLPKSGISVSYSLSEVDPEARRLLDKELK